jgi:hypothetical protein
MKTFVKLGVATAFVASMAVGCLTAGQKQTANTILEIAKYSCIVANATIPVPAIQQACQITDDLVPALQAVLADLATHDAAMKRAAAERCVDAGAK